MANFIPHKSPKQGKICGFWRVIMLFHLFSRFSRRGGFQTRPYRSKKCSRPISRVLYFLSTKERKCLPFILAYRRRQAHAAYPPASDEQSFVAGIHGLSTHQAYSLPYYDGSGELLPRLFTLTNLPKAVRRLFSVTLLCPREQLPVRKDGALCCPDFPPIRNRISGRPACCNF